MLQAFGEMIRGDQREYAESPEHQRVSHARQRPLGNHFPLQHHFPDEIGDPAAHRLDVKIGVFLGLQDNPPDFPKSPPKTKNGSCQQNEEQRPTPARTVGAPTASVAQGPTPSRSRLLKAVALRYDRSIGG